ncbi:hypothetical protein K0M31_001475 [Melipona bicolor]|uniref:Uncharacterized protein n=1 Tax=Melipona bicolor TaxID=60889 RepID=A0AA40GFK8_9HYME|nr:hypothetical protein K0M31_001475 [Melipona bicolor]
MSVRVRYSSISDPPRLAFAKSRATRRDTSRKEEDSLYRKRRKKRKRHKVHRLGRFRVEENSTLERARSEEDEDRGPVDAPRSRSTRRSSTIGLESPVPVYGSGVRGFFEQQADQVERGLPVESWTRCSSMRARQTDLLSLQENRNPRRNTLRREAA